MIAQQRPYREGEPPRQRCAAHDKPLIYTVAGYFNHQLSTLYREDPDDLEGPKGWCEDCKTEADDIAKQQGGCMSFLPIPEPPEYDQNFDEWADGTDLLMVPEGGVAPIIVCRCGTLPRNRKG